jgi:hypothetical protein
VPPAALDKPWLSVAIAYYRGDSTDTAFRQEVYADITKVLPQTQLNGFPLILLALAGSICKALWMFQKLK